MTPEELYGNTATEWLRRWDAGQSVWTVEMGGLGPGYEQAIQVACAEIVRDMHTTPAPQTDEEKAAWLASADKALDRADKMPDMGISGAMAGAAKTLAYKLCELGPAGLFAWLKANHPDRANDLIQVSNVWPGNPR